jgi:hypothetical protein
MPVRKKKLVDLAGVVNARDSAREAIGELQRNARDTCATLFAAHRHLMLSAEVIRGHGLIVHADVAESVAAMCEDERTKLTKFQEQSVDEAISELCIPF